jgi:hypothetical protein
MNDGYLWYQKIAKNHLSSEKTELRLDKTEIIGKRAIVTPANRAFDLVITAIPLLVWRCLCE